MELTTTNVERMIKRAIAEDRIIRGLDKTIKMAKLGKAELVVVANNCKGKDDLIHVAKLSDIPLFEYPGDNMDLGELCRKPYSVSALAIKGE